MLDKLKKLNLASAYTMISRFIIVPGILIILLVVLTTDRIDRGWGYVLIGFIIISEHIIAAWAVPKRAGGGSGGGAILAWGLATISESSILSGFFYVMFVLLGLLSTFWIFGISRGQGEESATNKHGK